MALGGEVGRWFGRSLPADEVPTRPSWRRLPAHRHGDQQPSHEWLMFVVSTVFTPEPRWGPAIDGSVQ